MNVIILEDEWTASEKLTDLLHRLDPSISVLAVLESVKEAANWLDHHPAPDLAFVDIQLSDDNSFSLFQTREINFPVVFTTAYDDYVLEAFEHNSLDYLLKPVEEARLKKALEKVKKFEAHFFQNRFNQLFDQFSQRKHRTKRRFLVKKGVDYVSVSVGQIAYFFTEYKVVFLVDREGKKYMVDKTLSDLENELDPTAFFRANRKFIVNIEAIEKFKSDNGKIQLHISPLLSEPIVVSKENAPNFRKWIDG